MRIIPVTQLKLAKTGIIHSVGEGYKDVANLTKKEKEVSAVITRLREVGFVPGQKVTVKNKYGDVYSISSNSDNPFAMRKTIADNILIEADDADILETQAKKNKTFVGIKAFFEKLLKK